MMAMAKAKSSANKPAPTKHGSAREASGDCDEA